MRRGAADDRVKLLHGPYRAPRLHVGDCATCLFRDCEVVVTGWTDAPISWPRALPVGSMGHPSLLVNKELARAIRLESAAAVMHWWGVSDGVIHRWRRALGVGRMDNPGSRRLILAASAKGAAVIRGVPLPPEQVERRRRTALEQDLGRNLRQADREDLWTAAEVGLLGNMPDAQLARRIGRSVNAVRIKRQRLAIPNPFDGRRRASGGR
jgi:hypothetical protein